MTHALVERLLFERLNLNPPETEPLLSYLIGCYRRRCAPPPPLLLLSKGPARRRFPRLSHTPGSIPAVAVAERQSYARSPRKTAVPGKCVQLAHTASLLKGGQRIARPL